MVPLHVETVAGTTERGSGSSPLPLGRLCEPPLRKVSSFLSDSQDSPSVVVRLTEPFWSGSAHVDLMVLCAQLQTLLEVETVGHAAARMGVGGAP